LNTPDGGSFDCVVVWNRTRPAAPSARRAARRRYRRRSIFFANTCVSSIMVPTSLPPVMTSVSAALISSFAPWSDA
jgi:hypothetical protein